MPCAHCNTGAQPKPAKCQPLVPVVRTACSHPPLHRPTQCSSALALRSFSCCPQHLLLQPTPQLHAAKTFAPPIKGATLPTHVVFLHPCRPRHTPQASFICSCAQLSIALHSAALHVPTLSNAEFHAHPCAPIFAHILTPGSCPSCPGVPAPRRPRPWPRRCRHAPLRCRPAGLRARTPRRGPARPGSCTPR